VTDARRPAGGGARPGAALLEEGERLRERVALARQVSSALASSATACCAMSAAARDAALHSCAQWRAWREGIAALRRRTDGAGRAVLRVCMQCEAVCFTPPGRDAAEEWIAPPPWIRERFRSGWRRPALSHGLCPRCALQLGVEVDQDVAPESTGAAGAAGAPARGVHAVLEALAQLEIAATAIVEGAAGAGAGAALDGALSRVAERMAATTPPHELRALTHRLAAFARRLRGGAARHGGPPPRPSAANRLRPSLRHP
jgi:hypothetical protein